jgi:hypothetical protein
MQLLLAEGDGLGDGEGDGDGSGDADGELPAEGGGENPGAVPDGSGCGLVIGLPVGSGDEWGDRLGPALLLGDPPVTASWLAPGGLECPGPGAGAGPVTAGVSCADPAAVCCRGIVTLTNDISRKMIAPETRMIMGGSKSIGCARMATAPLRAVVRSLSAATAKAISAAAMLGP